MSNLHFTVTCPLVTCSPKTLNEVSITIIIVFIQAFQYPCFPLVLLCTFFVHSSPSLLSRVLLLILNVSMQKSKSMIFAVNFGSAEKQASWVHDLTISFFHFPNFMCVSLFKHSRGDCLTIHMAR